MRQGYDVYRCMQSAVIPNVRRAVSPMHTLSSEFSECLGCNISYCNAHFPTFTYKHRRGGIKEKGQAHLHMGASLDKAKDSEESIFSPSDESLLHHKVGSSRRFITLICISSYFLKIYVCIKLLNGGHLPLFFCPLEKPLLVFSNLNCPHFTALEKLRFLLKGSCDENQEVQRVEYSRC